MAQNKLTRFYFRLKNAVRLFVWAYKNPNTLVDYNFKMLSSLLELILKVANEDRHMMTHIAYVHPEEGEKQIVSIWAGAGLAADPTKRIAELVSENKILKNNLAVTTHKERNFDDLADRVQTEYLNVENLSPQLGESVSHS